MIILIKHTKNIYLEIHTVNNNKIKNKRNFKISELRYGDTVPLCPKAACYWSLSGETHHHVAAH